jgi:mRNA-binding protein PUF3
MPAGLEKLQEKLRDVQVQRGVPQLELYQPQYASSANLSRHAANLNLNGWTSPYGLVNGVPGGFVNPGLPQFVQQPRYGMSEGPRSPRDNIGANVQSPLLLDFKATHPKGLKQWHLQDIQGYVAEFCGDQQGSRFIQNRVQEANSDEKQLIFNEILPDMVQLMQDVFGNYVIQKFFDHGDQTQKAQIAMSIKGYLIQLSTQMYGCRVVQKAIDHILTHQQAELIAELRPNVIRCVKDMNGNHVVQRAIERIPAVHIQFIVDAFVGRAGELSKHIYGCRVIQRVLEHCSTPVKHVILAELHKVADLVDDQYGNYVTQHMIEFGFDDDKDKVIRNVKANLMAWSKHKFASNVVEKCFACGSDDLRRELMWDIIKSVDQDTGDNGLNSFLQDQYANYVIREFYDNRLFDVTETC